MKIEYINYLDLFIAIFFSTTAMANKTTPVLNFSDLISGPSVGLGDGKGSGVIVTLWGQNLGTSQGASSVEFCDSQDVCRDGYIYYWKNADGLLPGGPANLYESHLMQEIAFSIPQSSNGLGRIKLTTASGVSELPFTVREGSIFHVASTGNDSNVGSFSKPWLTVAKADSLATAGDTVYIHNVVTYGDSSTGRVYYNNKGFKANKSNQFAYVSYPNTRAELYGKDGVHMYNTTGIVTSKLSVFASNCDDETLEGCIERGTNGIAPSDWGRVIGNAITDRPGMCSSGQAGAISGGIGKVEGSKIFGNYIYEYGCPNTGKLHHTTYMTIRDNANDKSIESWEMGWNYLKNNYAKNGLHFYDENVGTGTECGDLTTDMLIHNNVVVNQSGAGINLESACGWSQNTYIYNNLLVNVGLKLDVDCISGPECGGGVGSAIVIGDNDSHGLLGDVFLNNNTVYMWDSQDQTTTLQSCIVLRGSGDNAKLYLNDNVCFNDSDKPFFTTHSFTELTNHNDNVFGEGNLWFSLAVSNERAQIPLFDKGAIVDDPEYYLIDGIRLKVNKGSPLLNKSGVALTRDIYGTVRSLPSSIGAIEYIPSLPKYPPNFSKHILSGETQ